MQDKEQRKANHREYKKARAFTRGFLKKTEGAQQHCNTAEGTTDTRANQLCKDKNSQLTFTHSQLTNWDPGIQICWVVVLLVWMGAQAQALTAVTVPTHLQDLQGRTGQLLSTAQPVTLQLWSLGMGGDSEVQFLVLWFSGYISLTSYYNLMSIYKTNKQKNNQQETASPLLKFKRKKFGLELSQIYCF